MWTLIVACCHCVKLCAHAARDFRSQQYSPCLGCYFHVMIIVNQHQYMVFKHVHSTGETSKEAISKFLTGNRFHVTLRIVTLKYFKNIMVLVNVCRNGITKKFNFSQHNFSVHSSSRNYDCMCNFIKNSLTTARANRLARAFLVITRQPL